jgi:shikimate dehydrogenase
MKKACVIGFPIAHSRSPLIHNHWLKTHGLEGLYEKREVPPENLKSFLSNMKSEGYVGCNVTIPHKEAAIPLVAEIDAIVQKTGSLNTIYFENNILKATSTDGEGFYQNLIETAPNLNLDGKTAVILGAGGSARAIIERLLRTNLGQIIVVNRTQARAQELSARFGPRVVAGPTAPETQILRSACLLVNTTSQGMKGQADLVIDLEALPKSAVVADLVYVPLKTALLREAEALGLSTVGGLGMLLHQAVVGFEKWFGVKPIVTTELYAMIARDIDPDFK